jgi:phage shock protein PspC (stress-responsive transcriptional regulator)
VVKRGRLRRRTEHRLAAGVAGGIADRLNASVGFVRVILFLAIAWVPWSLEAYAAAALVIPPRGSDRPDWDNVIGLARLGALYGVPVLVLAGGINVGDSFDGPVGWWVAYLGLLAAGAVALLGADYRREQPRTRAEARAVVLAALPVGICAAGFAAAVLLEPGVRWERTAPLVALVGAVTVIVAAWRDRLGAFLPPAMLAVALVGLIVAADVRLEGGVGDEQVVPEPADGRPIVVRRAVGDVDLDLRKLTRDGRDATVEASVGVGSLDVSLPRRTRVVVDARLAKGQIDPFAVDADSTQGFDRHLVRSAQPRRGSSDIPTIRLRATVGLGTIDLSGGSDLVGYRP